MSDSPHATARAVVVQNSPSAAKNTNENSTPPKLDSSPFGDVDNSWVIMTTDGGNDTEPEEEIQEDVGLEEKPKKGSKTSPKKRAATNTEEEDTSPKKKRAPAKSKAATKTADEATEALANDKKQRSNQARSANTEDEVAKKSDYEAAESQGSGTERPSTPEAQTVKEAKTPKTPKTPKSPEGENIVEANDTTPRPARAKTHSAKPKAAPKQSSPVKGKRAGAEKVAEKVVLPTKWSEASTADKTLVSMKEAGKPWSEIRAKWLEMTGQDTASSTLPNR
ncbi:MAG: hypothetical protein L6R38_009503 [Xanthoria sp. 2 TBL-2021]|nr:MAG: hypothetical protein L6R38_009503 [Xanthoria sp. 2 TBL-2021]